MYVNPIIISEDLKLEDYGHLVLSNTDDHMRFVYIDRQEIPKLIQELEKLIH